MPTLLSMSSPMMAKYLLGDLTPEESQQIEEAVPCNYRLRRELEAAKEKLTAAYVVGGLRGKDRLKFETAFLASEEGKRKIKIARAWIEEGGSACPEWASVAPSSTPKNAVGAGRQRLKKVSRRRPQLAVGGRGQQPL